MSPFFHSLLSSLAIQALLVQGLPSKVAKNEFAVRDTTSDDVIRGVNIGGWLILESYMNYDVMGDAADQWTFDQTDGAEAALQSHWSSYFQESDIEAIAGFGLNTYVWPVHIVIDILLTCSQCPPPYRVLGIQQHWNTIHFWSRCISRTGSRLVQKSRHQGSHLRSRSSWFSEWI